VSERERERRRRKRKKERVGGGRHMKKGMKNI